MDSHEKRPTKPRHSKAAADDSRVSTRDTIYMVNGAGQDPTAEPTQGSTSTYSATLYTTATGRPTGPEAPRVHGQPVSEMGLLFNHGTVGWLITSDGGNHEFARVFYMGGKYRLRDGFSRVGGSDLWRTDVDSEGATMHWSCGRTTAVPRAWFQVTWKP